MIYLHLASMIGFLCYVGIFAWRKFEQSDSDFTILTLYLHRCIVICFYAMIFGFFGVFYNLDAIVDSSAVGVVQKLIYSPEILPLARSFTVGLAGPLAGAQLVSSVVERRNEKSHKGTQVDDISHGTQSSNWFVSMSRRLFS